ncbi:agmatinase [Sneathiella sp. P13V-1]|uniref:agmatinase n=1 Tax=Sneathiella sp. P13V-1 TaxID=2697366 RepID=UPI00187BB715|nr:agmatinase [Sneathiella sp. P13V-1]MBE7636501.1 agmatinase [Sneathiella sp. P13V-1]
MASDWNEDKLKELQELYGESHGGELHKPEFQKVANNIFSEGGTRLAPYSGIPTFLDAPYRQVDPSNPDISDLEVALIGIPMDLGVTNRPGARFGPRALRAIERIGPYNHVLDCAPVHEMKVADIGDIPFDSRYRLEKSLDNIEDYMKRIVEAGVVPLSVGGDHSITHPILKAIGKEKPVALIHIDAHCDTGGSFDETKFHHGGPFRNAVLDGVLDPTRTIQIGIRGSAEYLWEFSEKSGMTVVHAEEVPHMGIPALIQKTKDVIGDGPVYVTFDIDGIDPSFAPGTGTPEVGGLTTREVLEFLRGLKGINICGGDVVEVAPQYDPTTNSAHVGAQVLFEILSLMHHNVHIRK